MRHYHKWVLALAIQGGLVGAAYASSPSDYSTKRSSKTSKQSKAMPAPVVQAPVATPPVAVVPPPAPPAQIARPAAPVVQPSDSKPKLGGFATGFYLEGSVGLDVFSSLKGKDKTVVKPSTSVDYKFKRPSFGVSAAVGGELAKINGLGPDDRVRGAIAYNYATAKVKSVNSFGTAATGTDLGKANLHTVVAQVEYLPDLPIGLGPLRPYVGAGIGYGFATVGKGDNEIKPRGLALKGIAGVSYQVAKNVEVFGEYNYLTLVQATAKKTPLSSNKVKKINLGTHLFNIGGRITF